MNRIRMSRLVAFAAVSLALLGSVGIPAQAAQGRGGCLELCRGITDLPVRSSVGSPTDPARGGIGGLTNPSVQVESGRDKLLVPLF